MTPQYSFRRRAQSRRIIIRGFSTVHVILGDLQWNVHLYTAIAATSLATIARRPGVSMTRAGLGPSAQLTWYRMPSPAALSSWLRGEAAACRAETVTTWFAVVLVSLGTLALCSD